MGLGVQAGVIGAGGSVLLAVVVSSVIGDGTLLDQSVVVTADCVLHNGREGDGLVGALAEILNGGHQFHGVFTQADAELLGGVRMVVCHCCWG